MRSGHSSGGGGHHQTPRWKVTRSLRMFFAALLREDLHVRTRPRLVLRREDGNHLSDERERAGVTIRPRWRRRRFIGRNQVSSGVRGV